MPVQTPLATQTTLRMGSRKRRRRRSCRLFLVPVCRLSAGSDVNCISGLGDTNYRNVWYLGGQVFAVQIVWRLRRPIPTHPEMEGRPWLLVLNGPGRTRRPVGWRCPPVPRAIHRRRSAIVSPDDAGRVRARHTGAAASSPCYRQHYRGGAGGVGSFTCRQLADRRPCLRSKCSFGRRIPNRRTMRGSAASLQFALVPPGSSSPQVFTSWD